MNELFAQQQRVERYFAKGRYELSAFSFVNIFAWSDFFRFEFIEIGGCLCVFAHQDAGCFQYCPPLGDATPEVVAQCFDHMRRINGTSLMSRIENVPDTMLEIFDRRIYSPKMKTREYCYLRREIAEMKGLAFASQRWMWNHFRKRHAYAFEPYRPQDLAACAELYDRWADNRIQRHSDAMYQEMIRENKIVHRRLLEHFEALKLIGRVIKVNGAVKGYTFGYALNDRIFCDLLEIADLSLKGLPSVIFRELCCDPQLERYEMINVMDDCGLPDVGEAKKHFKPRLFVPSYTVSLR